MESVRSSVVLRKELRRLCAGGPVRGAEQGFEIRQSPAPVFPLKSSEPARHLASYVVGVSMIGIECIVGWEVWPCSPMMSRNQVQHQVFDVVVRQPLEFWILLDVHERAELMAIGFLHPAALFARFRQPDVRV